METNLKPVAMEATTNEITSGWIFEGHNVEVFELNGEVYFNPYDVGACLEMSDATIRDHLRKMNSKQVIKLTNLDVGLTNIRKLNNAGENFLTEAGVYKLVFKSRKPEAERFTDWIAEEVLPAIRKHGMYATDELLDNPDLLIATATRLKEEKEKRILAEKENLKLSSIIEKQKPKIEYVDEILSSEGALLVTQIAADYGLSAKRLNKILKEEKVQRKVRDQWILYSDYAGKGYTTSETAKAANGKHYPQTLWTQKGRMFIHGILTNRKIKALKDIENEQTEIGMEV